MHLGKRHFSQGMELQLGMELEPQHQDTGQQHQDKGQQHQDTGLHQDKGQRLTLEDMEQRLTLAGIELLLLGMEQVVGHTVELDTLKDKKSYK